MDFFLLTIFMKREKCKEMQREREITGNDASEYAKHSQPLNEYFLKVDVANNSTICFFIQVLLVTLQA